MASNQSQNFYDSEITDKRIVPYASNGTGTIITKGITVIGTNTLFTTELTRNSYLVKLSTNEFRRIVGCDSDTLAYLEAPFTVDISTSTPSIISATKANCVEISVSVPFLTAGGSQNADGKVCSDYSATLKRLPAGTTYDVSKAHRDRSGTNDHVTPVIVDFTGSEGVITVMY